jgi:cysteine-rich repeat protein
VQEGTEECDDGNMVNNDACSNMCKKNGVTYSQQFLQSQTSASQCTAWNSFRGALMPGSYTKITLRGSQDMIGTSCAGVNANTLCNNLKNGTVTTLACDGRTWRIGNCGNGVEINSNNTMCSCTDGHIVRPCIGNSNWGGMNGPTCSAVTQTLEVICE